MAASVHRPFICSEEDHDHCPRALGRRCDLKYWFFRAAEDGCLPCVQHCIEVLHVPPYEVSDNQNYTALAWSVWTLQKDPGHVGARNVMNYLQTFQIPNTPPVLLRVRLRPFLCVNYKNHCPTTSAKRKSLKYWLFMAARDGCLQCVRFTIEQLGADVFQTSDRCGYNLRDWAQWAIEKKKPGAEDVEAYLNFLRLP